MKMINGLKMTFVAMFMSLLYTAVSVFAGIGTPSDVVGGITNFLNPATNPTVLIVLLMGSVFVIILDIVLSYRNWKAAFGFGALIGVAASTTPTVQAWFTAFTGLFGIGLVLFFMVVAGFGMYYKQRRFAAAANIVDAEGEVFKDNMKEAGNTSVDIYKRMKDVQSKRAHIRNLINDESKKFSTATTDAERTKISAGITKLRGTLTEYNGDIKIMEGELKGIELKKQAVSREFAQDSMTE
ncbi:MAG: hypothetical protein KAJ20_02470 [Candidatus Aenigmarchaeota archaeon]|nr:hypothetical protein [Candidatus Aenigmarchaeota archaeon]